VARLDRARDLQQTVGERRLAVIDVGDDREVADVLRVGHFAACGLTRNRGFVIQATETRNAECECRIEKPAELLHSAFAFCVLSFRGLPLMPAVQAHADRKSTRLNSSHQIISYAVFCLKK